MLYSCFDDGGTRYLQRSIREWAIRQGWDGRPVRVEQAQGIVVAALGVLAGLYGYGMGG